ncbi:beta-ketoacyl synthase N-terminal-like domain-containing protein, partial [Serratia proteamaculans]
GTGVMGNVGQADYAAANAFLDRFAHQRNDLVGLKQRRGRTLSINWPLWKEGGMRVDDVTASVMKQTTGMIAMDSDTGIRAFYQSLQTGHAQVLVMEGVLEQMRTAVFATAPVPDTSTDTVLPDPSRVPDDVTEKAQQYLRKQFSVVLKLPMAKIDSDVPLEQYGMDSILAVNLTAQLEKTFGSLPKTLFFEYQTIAELTAYFVEAYPSRLLSLFEGGSATLETPASPLPSGTAATPGGRKRKRVMPAVRRPGQPESSALDIAIVGISGRYPQSRNVQEFWNNLQAGKDCITEIPQSRWDWREYFSEDRSQPGAHYSKWGGFIDGVEEFDPLFFNISPLEAMVMDPQERLFLEHVWMAIEDAGYTRERLHKRNREGFAGQVGVYAGVMYGEYQLFGAEASLTGNRMALSGSYASIANRV